jgi:hypothetical protein
MTEYALDGMYRVVLEIRTTAALSGCMRGYLK